MTLATKIAALKDKLYELFEEKSNKVTEWSSTVTDTHYPSEKLVKDSLDDKEDSSNKVTSWTGTPSDTNYPSEKLVKDGLDAKEVATNKVTSWSGTVSDTNYPSEKLVKDSLDDKLDAADVPTKTSDLTNDGADGINPFLSAHQSLSDIGGIVDVEKQTTADTGYAATYVIKQGSSSSKTAISTKINIPKDFLVKSGEVKVVASADLATLGNGYEVGDKYIDFVINAKDGSATDEHMYINVKDLVEDTTYVADGTTLQLVSGEFSIADGGVDTTQLADDAVTAAKIDDGAVGTDALAASAVTTAKINDGAVTSDKIDPIVVASWLTVANVDDQIEDAVDSLLEALDPTPSSGE